MPATQTACSTMAAQWQLTHLFVEHLEMHKRKRGKIQCHIRACVRGVRSCLLYSALCNLSQFSRRAPPTLYKNMPLSLRTQPAARSLQSPSSPTPTKHKHECSDPQSPSPQHIPHDSCCLYRNLFQCCIGWRVLKPFYLQELVWPHGIPL